MTARQKEASDGFDQSLARLASIQVEVQNHFSAMNGNNYLGNNSPMGAIQFYFVTLVILYCVTTPQRSSGGKTVKSKTR